MMMMMLTIYDGDCDKNLEGSEFSHKDILTLIVDLCNFAVAKGERYLDHIVQLEKMTIKTVFENKCVSKQMPITNCFK